MGTREMYSLSVERLCSTLSLSLVCVCYSSCRLRRHQKNIHFADSYKCMMYLLRLHIVIVIISIKLIRWRGEVILHELFASCSSLFSFISILMWAIFASCACTEIGFLSLLRSLCWNEFVFDKMKIHISVHTHLRSQINNIPVECVSRDDHLSLSIQMMGGGGFQNQIKIQYAGHKENYDWATWSFQTQFYYPLAELGMPHNRTAPNQPSDRPDWIDVVYSKQQKKTSE